MSIQVLTTEVAAKIAAGEVVERPASVVKELMENSLDADATQISVEVRRGGLELIRVVDNGHGIAAEDVEKAFLRHATSKIASARDLDRIQTLGFRGEALPSIAAVSQVEKVTRVAEEVAGTRVEFRYGSAAGRESTSRPVGTTVSVRHLFQNVPARLKFVKSPATENGRISSLVSRFSLAYPSVRFNLIIDGRQTFSSPGTGVPRDTLARVYGPETAEAMQELESEVEGVGRVSGFVGPPATSRAQRRYITLFVNRRWVQDRRLSYAVEEAYQGLLMVGRYPIAVLDITLPVEDIDVNVHPTKSEVRLRRGHDVFSLVQRAVREALVELTPVPAVMPRPVSVQSSLTPRSQPLGSDLAGWARGPSQAQAEEKSTPAVTPMKALPILRIVGQVSDTYIVTEGPDGMYLVDQHAAHERVLFERVERERRESRVQVQGMLSPATIELTPSQEEALKPREDLLREHGFSFEPFGERSYILRAVPASLSDRNPDRAFLDILDSLMEDEKEEDRDTRIATSIACHSAVRAGDTLEREEMEELVRLLEGTGNPHTCPHGRPTMIHLSSTILEKGFGRR
ncbi:MAG: DNA mismatch repair endonuclease MutL [Dehalococcoidia bacterium]